MVSQRFAKMVSRPRWRVLLEAPDFEVCQLSSRSAPLCFCSVKSSRESSFFSHFVLTWTFWKFIFAIISIFDPFCIPQRTAEPWKVGAAQTAYGDLWSVIDDDWCHAQALTHRDFWLVALLCSSGPIHFKHNLLMRSELWSLCCNCAIVLILVIETIDTLERCSKKLRKCIWILERFFFNFHKCRWPHWSSKSHRLMLVTCNPSKFFLYVTAVIVAVE